MISCISGCTGKVDIDGQHAHSVRRIVTGSSGGPALESQNRSGGVSTIRSREESRRHTLSGDHQPTALLRHQQFNAITAVTVAGSQSIHQFHSRHLLPLHSQYGLSSRHNTTMDLEVNLNSLFLLRN